MDKLLPWIVLAVAVFWAVGAYNRLVRLRNEAHAAFATLDGHCRRQLELVTASLPQSVSAQLPAVGDRAPDDATSAWSALHESALHCAAALGAMRPRPLDAGAAAGFAQAYAPMLLAWQRVLREAHDLAGAPLPDAVALRWQQLALHADDGREAFNAAVQRYNEAIAQFPAVLLARAYRFAPAGPL